MEAMTEQQMREHNVPYLKTERELMDYIHGLVSQEHDYGTAAYACSLCSVATFNYVAKKLGITGFQASCADMDIIRRTRCMEGPFMLIDGSNALYPQYDLHEKLSEFLEEIGPWLKEHAQKKILDSHNNAAHPDVERHWRELSTKEFPSNESTS